VVLVVENGFRESTESRVAILRDLKRRGLAPPKLVIGDGHLGMSDALTAVFPEAAEQRRWNHRLLNILDEVPLKRQAEAGSLAVRSLLRTQVAGVRRSSSQLLGKREVIVAPAEPSAFDMLVGWFRGVPAPVPCRRLRSALVDRQRSQDTVRCMRPQRRLRP
jgi:hypothetical protein